MNHCLPSPRYPTRYTIASIDFCKYESNSISSGIINICSAPSLEDFSMEINGMHQQSINQPNAKCVPMHARSLRFCMSWAETFMISNELLEDLCLNSPSRRLRNPFRVESRGRELEHETSLFYCRALSDRAPESSASLFSFSTFLSSINYHQSNFYCTFIKLKGWNMRNELEIFLHVGEHCGDGCVIHIKIVARHLTAPFIGITLFSSVQLVSDRMSTNGRSDRASKMVARRWRWRRELITQSSIERLQRSSITADVSTATNICR